MSLGASECEEGMTGGDAWQKVAEKSAKIDFTWAVS